jgi:hypothetical protein
VKSYFADPSSLIAERKNEKASTSSDLIIDHMEDIAWAALDVLPAQHRPALAAGPRVRNNSINPPKHLQSSPFVRDRPSGLPFCRMSSSALSQ